MVNQVFPEAYIYIEILMPYTSLKFSHIEPKAAKFVITREISVEYLLSNIFLISRSENKKKFISIQDLSNAIMTPLLFLINMTHEIFHF